MIDTTPARWRGGSLVDLEPHGYERGEVADHVPSVAHVLAHARGARRAAVFYHHARKTRVLRFDRRRSSGWLGVLPENCLLKCSPVRAFEFQIIDYDRKCRLAPTRPSARLGTTRNERQADCDASIDTLGRKNNETEAGSADRGLGAQRCRPAETLCHRYYTLQPALAPVCICATTAAICHREGLTASLRT